MNTLLRPPRPPWWVQCPEPADRSPERPPLGAVQGSHSIPSWPRGNQSARQEHTGLSWSGAGKEAHREEGWEQKGLMGSRHPSLGCSGRLVCCQLQASPLRGKPPGLRGGGGGGEAWPPWGRLLLPRPLHQHVAPSCTGRFRCLYQLDSITGMAARRGVLPWGLRAPQCPRPGRVGSSGRHTGENADSVPSKLL